MKTFTGKITSIISPESAVVLVTRKVKHPLYGKTTQKSKKYLVHNQVGAKLDQIVTIVETRPISKRKNFKIVSLETKPNTKKATKIQSKTLRKPTKKNSSSPSLQKKKTKK